MDFFKYPESLKVRCPKCKYFWSHGWNLLASLNSSTVNEAFLWGNDLSGSMQGAGGVGGLLAISSGTNHDFLAYDGNGNVSALFSAADSTVAANYEYGPFGEVTRATGPMAKLNPFRFSTKYQDDESDLLYYGYRYLNTSTGRWLSRDPIGEQGGENLYDFADNSTISAVDKMGLICVRPLPPGKCGPDVTAAVEKTLEEVQRSFDNPSPNSNRRDSGIVLYQANYLGNPGSAWDIEPLAALGNRGKLAHLPEGLTAEDFGSGNCNGTVTYKGVCVYAGALNYILFGKINRLSHDAFSNQPFKLISPIKINIDWSWSNVEEAIIYQNFFRWTHFNKESLDAFTFARAGYFGEPVNTGSAQTGCSASVKKWPAVPMKWHWKGIHY